MKKRKNLKKIAEKVFDASLQDKWRPTTRDIEKRYKLNESQSTTVKRYVKAIAANLGVMWAYDPEMNSFRVAPDNAPEIAKRMLRYQVEHWRDAGNSTLYVFTGAQKQGYAPKALVKRVSSLNSDFEKRVTAIEENVKSL